MEADALTNMAMEEAREALEVVRQKTSSGYQLGLVLGSGLGELAGLVQNSIVISFSALPGFPGSTVSGHAGELVAGDLHGIPVVLLSGRAHYYEKGHADAMRIPLALMKALGCQCVILTNSAGSLHPEMWPGSVMLIEDHINFSGTHPLIGEPTEHRFVGLTEVYDKALCAQFEDVAQAKAIRLHKGVYMWFSGPSFETPAEIRMAHMLGADAVGMSTVPEAILGRFFGLQVVALSAITNLAAGMSGGELSHEETKQNAPLAAHKMRALIEGVLEGMTGK